MDEADGLPAPRRYWAMAAILSGIAMGVLDSSIVNVALPSMARELDVDPATSVWIVNAYQLAIVVSLLPFASLGEIFGFRRIYIFGQIVFVLASAACVLSDAFWPLLIARIVQGIGTSASMCSFGGLVRATYPSRMLGQGISYNVIVVALFSTMGPSICSALLAIGPWPILFAINIPIGLFSLWPAFTALPATDRAARPFDWVSAVLSALSIGLFIVAIDHLASDTLLAGIGLVIAAVAGVLLVRRESTRAAPLVPLDLMRLVPFSRAVVGSICYFGAQTMGLLALPFRFQHELGLTQVQTGAYMTPWPLGAVLMAPLAGRLADRIPAPVICTVGGTLLTVGLLLIALLPVAGTTAVLGAMLIGGLGAGLFQAPNNRSMLMAVPRARSGSAGGMQAIARQFGAAGGAALVGLLFSAVPAHATAAALAGAVVLAAAALAVSALGVARGMS